MRGPRPWRYRGASSPLRVGWTPGSRDRFVWILWDPTIADVAPPPTAVATPPDPVRPGSWPPAGRSRPGTRRCCRRQAAPDKQPKRGPVLAPPKLVPGAWNQRAHVAGTGRPGHRAEVTTGAHGRGRPVRAHDRAADGPGHGHGSPNTAGRLAVGDTAAATCLRTTRCAVQATLPCRCTAVSGGRLLGVEESKALDARAGVVPAVHDHARGDRSTRQPLSVSLARLEWIVGRGIA
jgi:hypothetical protein